MPTRLVDADDPNNLKLVSGQQVGAVNYVALSHRWGELKANEVPSYCTTRENIRQRENGFQISDAQTFRDAIDVVRSLDLRYIWIDSLCIIQGPSGDWAQEAERMEDVYSSAYFTIAATSATNSKSGFLGRSSQSLCVQDSSNQQIFVCPVADFDKEIEDAALNSRAWVMQERYLSCRTLHFGANQAYWECGGGIYCEDLTRLTSNPFV